MVDCIHEGRVTCERADRVNVNTTFFGNVMTLPSLILAIDTRFLAGDSGARAATILSDWLGGLTVPGI